ncbi:MAG: hypothetical protein KKD44_11390 [Proteobacteria bacterium]|nr:hypothetical protein [Pseudomonadota bacterium]
MSKIFRPNNKESILLSKIESSKERDRRLSINMVRDHGASLSNSIAMKLVENKIIETKSKNSLEEQISGKLDELCRADDFDVDYQVAPFRSLIPNPNLVSLYLTAFVLETLINHKDVIDIYGSDEEIYHCINKQTMKFMPE